MRVNGITVAPPKPETVVVRGVVFTLVPVIDHAKFETLCPEPNPPQRRYPDGRVVTVTDDKDYQAKLDIWGHRRFEYMIVESMSGVEWDTVDLNNPETWKNYKDDMRNAGLSEAECMFILNKILDVCGLNTSKIETETQNFLAQNQEKEPQLVETIIQDTEQSSTLSGDSTKDSE
jgi:hypothetical protein